VGTIAPATKSELLFREMLEEQEESTKYWALLTTYSVAGLDYNDVLCVISVVSFKG